MVRHFWTAGLQVGLAIAASFCVQSGLSAQVNEDVAKAGFSHRMLAADADASIVLLATTVFDQHRQGTNTSLDSVEFGKSQDTLRAELATWVQNEKLRQILRSGWTRSNFAAAGADMSSVIALETALPDKDQQVSLSDLKDYTRYLVDRAMRRLPKEQLAKSADPARAAKSPFAPRAASESAQKPASAREQRKIEKQQELDAGQRYAKLAIMLLRLLLPLGIFTGVGVKAYYAYRK